MRRWLFAFTASLSAAAACDQSEIVGLRLHDGGAAGQSADGGVPGSMGGDGETTAGAPPEAGAASTAGGGEGVQVLGGAAGAGDTAGASGVGGAAETVCEPVQLGPACAVPLLGSAPSLLPEGSPRSLSLGNYAGDQSLDIAYADDALGGIGVLVGNGDGTFQAPVFTATGAQPWDIARVFLDADANEDLAVVNYGDGTVSVLFGKGDARFQPAVSYPVGDKPIALRAMTMNADAKADLVVLNSADDSVSILLNKGDNTFNAAKSYFGFSHATCMALAELNGDWNDLLLGNDFGVTVLLGSSTGALSATPQHFAMGSVPSALATGYLNGDKFVDVVAALGADDSVKVLLGKGDGSFDVSNAYPSGDNPSSAVMTDMNGDAIADVVVANAATTGAGSSVSVLLGKGDGSLLPPRSFLVGRAPVKLLPGNVDHDDFTDLVVVNQSVAGDTSSFDIGILLGKGDGSLAAPRALAAGSSPRDVASADLNHDCLPDLVVADGADQSVDVLFGKLGGGYEPKQSHALGAAPTKVLAGDFGGSGRVDVQVLADRLYRLVGQADGNFGIPLPLMGDAKPIADFTMADFNGDGQLDTAIVDGQASGCAALTSSTSLVWGPCLPVGSFPTSIAAGDLDGDGQLDLITADRGSSQLSLLRGHGVMPFDAAVAIPVPSARTVLLGDLDHDGDLDVTLGSDDYLFVLFNDGSGSLGAPVHYEARSYPSLAPQLADLNGDGFLDIVGTKRLASSLHVRLNDGQGAFPDELVYPVGAEPYGFSVGDFNLDGQRDVAVAASGAGSITLLTAGTCLR